MAFPRVKPLNFGFHICDSKWAVTPERTQSWTDLDLWLILKGRGSVGTPQGPFSLGAGSCLVLRGGEPYTFFMEPRAPFHHYFCHFVFEGFEEPLGFKRMGPLPPLFRSVPRWRLLSSLLEKSLRYYRLGPSGREKSSDWLGAALAEIETVDEDLRQHRASGPGLATALDREAKAMGAHPEKDHHIASMAAALGMSRGYFSKCFTARFGVSPKNYLMTSRMELAQHLLKNTDHPMSAISEAMGHGNPFLFSKQFRKYWGMSPRDFRKKGPA